MAEIKREVEGPMKLKCDNKAAIGITHNPVKHELNTWKLTHIF